MLQDGWFMYVQEGHTDEQTKELLLGVLFARLAKLSKMDEFWIVNEPVEGDPLNREKTIGWKIQIPHMDI